VAYAPDGAGENEEATDAEDEQVALDAYAA
jgi:hypothetical protein